MSKKTVRITRAENDFRRTALQFIKGHYGVTLGTDPADEPDHLFVATQHDEIVGTMGINFWSTGGLPRLARIYRFNWKSAPHPVVPKTIVEYCRWTATTPYVSNALIYAATEFAMREGKTCGWCEHSDEVHRICTRMGLVLHVVDARLEISAVADGDKMYYDQNPSVKFYMCDLAHVPDALAHTIAQ